MTQTRKALQEHLLTQQITLFQHFSALLRHLSQRIIGQDLSPSERRLMQRELAGLKKAMQVARSRLKSSKSPHQSPHQSSHTHPDFP